MIGGERARLPPGYLTAFPLWVTLKSRQGGKSSLDTRNLGNEHVSSLKQTEKRELQEM